MITKVRIENFKSFEDATVELGKFNVLIGPNNSGKSNFCSAFQLIHNLAISSGDTVFSNRFAVSQMDRVEYRGIRLSFDIKNNENLYSYAVDFRRESPSIARETTKINNSIIIKSEPKQPIEVGSITLVQSLNPNDSILFERKDEIRDIVKVFTAMHFYRFIPSSIHKPAYHPGNSPVLIDESGSGLPAVLDYILKKNRDAYINIVERIRKKFKDIEDIILEPSMVEEQGKYYQENRIAFKLKGRKEPLESHHISDGISYFLLFFTLMNLPDKPEIVFIEEPENGIHPSNLKEIIGHIRELSEENHCQVIITTHSPYLLDLVKKEEVLVLHRENEGATQITRMSDIPGIEDFSKGFYLGELWANYGEERLLKGKIDDED